jgi:hypothetical protein
VAILAAAALCTWRFGPWYDDSDSNSTTPETLQARNTCDSCCNGLASNCNLPLNQVTFAMVHNAMSSRDDLFAGYNHLEPLEEAMVAGYRGLMLDSCNCAGSVEEEVKNYFNGDEGDAVRKNGGESYQRFISRRESGRRVNFFTFLSLDSNKKFSCLLFMNNRAMALFWDSVIPHVMQGSEIQRR